MGSTTTPRTTTARRARRTRRATAASILALALAACSSDADDSAASDTAEPAADYEAGDSAADAADNGFVRSTEGVEDGFDIGVVGRDVIIEMRVVLSSDDIQRTVAAIMADASALGGGVASSDVNYGSGDDEEGREGYAVLVVKVPPQSLDRLLAGLDDTGTVQSINQSAQDVTEQLIDLDVRISNARQSVANVREFMDRTENLNELVTLEGELTRRQTELERLEAQQRNLSDRVALSTVTIEVVPTAAVPEPAADDGLADAFRTGWEAFAAFFFGLAFVLAVTLPFLALAAVLLGAAWVIASRLGRHRGVTTTADDPDRLTEEPAAETVSASRED